MNFKIFSFLFLFGWIPLHLLQAAEFKGFVRTVNYEGQSFSIDGPPLERAQVSSKTKFEGETGMEAFRKNLKEGDYVRIEGKRSSNGLWAVSSVEVQKGGKEKKENELSVKLDQTFLIEVLQSAIPQGTDYQLYFSQIVDELCNTGMNCVDQGRVTVKLSLSRGKEKKEIELTSEGGRKPLKPVSVEALGLKVELIEVGEYAALLVLRKAN